MAGRKRQLRQALPIRNRGIPPPPRSQHLPVEIGTDGGEPLLIDVGPEPGPYAPIGFDLSDSPIIVIDERSPKRAVVAQAIAPRHMMEPQEIFVRYALRIGEAAGDRRSILGGGVAAADRPVEADPPRIGLVVITGVPARLAEAARPGLRSVVVVVGELMGKPERGHVIDHRLARS